MSDASISKGGVIVYALYGDSHTAETAARKAVEQRLCACANIQSPCVSYYIWEGAAEKQTEVPVLFKTTESQREALVAWIGRHHDYAVPAILSWPVDATPAYARWMHEAVGEA